MTDKNKEKNKEVDQLLESNYDGIQEYDNDLPRWWVNIFWLTTFFAIGYVIYVHGGFRPSDEERIAARVSQLESTKAEVAKSTKASSPEVTEEFLVGLLSNEQSVDKGKEVYIAKCAACHGQLGEGLIGPNLTDKYWIHGGSMMDMYNIIQEGVIDKGMLAWKGVIPESDIQALTAYIRKLEGTNPPNAKEAQGDLYES